MAGNSRLTLSIQNQRISRGDGSLTALSDLGTKTRTAWAIDEQCPGIQPLSLNERQYSHGVGVASVTDESRCPWLGQCWFSCTRHTGTHFPSKPSEAANWTVQTEVLGAVTCPLLSPPSRADIVMLLDLSTSFYVDVAQKVRKAPQFHRRRRSASAVSDESAVLLQAVHCQTAGWSLVNDSVGDPAWRFHLYRHSSTLPRVSPENAWHLS